VCIFVGEFMSFQAPGLAFHFPHHIDALFADLFMYLIIHLPLTIQFKLSFLVEMRRMTFEKGTLPAGDVKEVTLSLSLIGVPEAEKHLSLIKAHVYKNVYCCFK